MAIDYDYSFKHWKQFNSIFYWKIKLEINHSNSKELVCPFSTTMPWVWLFIQTFNNSWKPFNSIFNSKWNPNYSFKKELFINKKWNYSFSENIYSIENWIIAHGYFQGGPSYILWQVGHMVMLAHRLDTNQVCIKDIIDQNRGHWKGRHIFFFIKISWLRLHCVTGWLYWSKLSGYWLSQCCYIETIFAEW